MVKEARYAWDDEENQTGLPDRRDRFDDLDDAPVDLCLPKTARDSDQADRPGDGKGNVETD